MVGETSQTLTGLRCLTSYFFISNVKSRSRLDM